MGTASTASVVDAEVPVVARASGLNVTLDSYVLTVSEAVVSHSDNYGVAGACGAEPHQL